jgi:hypothetical protein
VEKRLSALEKRKVYSCKQLNVDKIWELLPPSFNSWHPLAQKSAIQWQLFENGGTIGWKEREDIIQSENVDYW